MRSSVILIALFCSSVFSHEMTPTYPSWSISHIEGIQKTRMAIFNKRSDVNYYEIGVFTSEWQPIPFVSSYKVMKIDYLTSVKFDVYITEANSLAAEYICSISKLQGDTYNKTMVASKICSRFK
jgi:hypothetical protein